MARPRKYNYNVPKYVYFKNGRFRYKAQNERERMILGKTWVTLGLTQNDAWRAYPEIMDKIGGISGMTRLFDRYEQEVIPTKAKRTQKDNLTQLPRLRGVFGHMEPQQIRRTHGIEYIKIRAKTSTAQSKQEFSLLRHVMSCAVDWDEIPVNPLLGTRVNDYLKIKVRDRTPELWELEAVKKHGSKIISLFIDFKYMSGLDQSTCFGLLIPAFDGPGLPVKRSKTNKKGYVEWSTEFESVCRELIAYNNNRCEYLFCNQIGGPLKVDSFSQQFRRAVQAAIANGDLLEAFTPNDIRSGHATDAEEIHGLNASDQLLNSPGAKKHYVHKRMGEKITPLPRPKNV